MGYDRVVGAIVVRRLEFAGQNVFRSPRYVSAFLVIMVGFCGILVGISVGGSMLGVDDVVMTPVIATVVIYFNWVAIFHSRVVVRAEGLFVINVVRCTFIPWGCVTQVVIDDGLEVHVGEERPMRSLHFNGTLIGQFRGFPSYRGVCARLDAAWREAVGREGGPIGVAAGERCRRWWRVPVLPLMVCVVVFGSVSVAHGMAAGVVRF